MSKRPLSDWLAELKESADVDAKLCKCARRAFDKVAVLLEDGDLSEDPSSSNVLTAYLESIIIIQNLWRLSEELGITTSSHMTGR